MKEGTDSSAWTPRPPELADAALLRPGALFDLTGSTAIVVGGGGGVGAWLALGLAGAGAGVVVSDVSAQRAEGVANLIDAGGGTACALAGDVTDPTTMARLFAAASSLSSGPLRVLVNSAAVNRRAPALDVDAATYDHVMAVDLRMPFFLSQAAAAELRRQGGGSIIHVSSTNARVGLESTSVYASAKAGLEQLVRSLAVEWSEMGIRVNCIAPGFLMTELSMPLWRQSGKRTWILDRVPMARPGQPHELVGTCLLLASAAGSFITGQTLTVDGGYLAGSNWERAGAGL